MLTEAQRCQEKTYWMHLKNQKFIKIFKSEYQYQLLIPQKFVGSLTTSFDAIAKVQDPSKIIWEFGLSRRSTLFYFDHGWEKFVRAHSLQENDVLVFTYIGQMYFDVLIFENQTSCEKVSSYFLEGLYIHDEQNEAEQSSSSERVLPSTEKSAIYTWDFPSLKKPAEKHTLAAASQRQSPLRHANKKAKETIVAFPSSPHQDSMQKIDKADCFKSPSIKTSGVSSEKTMAKDTECFLPADHVKGSTQLTEEPMASASAAILMKPKQFHKDVLITELQKQKALQLAYASARGIWSVYTMRPSYISQGFSMTLATKWAKQYLPAQSQDIILRTKSQTWDVRFYRKGTGYALTGGWKKFALDNNLQEDDICSFYLDTSESKVFTLDVDIFRPRDIQISEAEISEASFSQGNKKLGQKRKPAKMLDEID